MIVVSPSGAQPIRARKFISAGARYPASRNSSTETRRGASRASCRPRRRCSDVRVDGQLGPERLEHDDLLRRVRDVVVAADHVGDPVDPVVDRRGEVVDRPAVGAEDDDVLELGGGELDPALDGVVPADHALVRHPDPDRALVLVGLPLRDEPRRLGATALGAVELEVRRAVPFDPEPAQRALDLLDRLLDLAARVGVLDPQEALPPRPRAKSQLKRNVCTPPMWRNPVGLGAMRTRTLMRRGL